jgi:hypothetical protein
LHTYEEQRQSCDKFFHFKVSLSDWFIYGS